MDELRFNDRVVVVTGAGRGFGREYARLSGRGGAAVVVNDRGGSQDGSGSSSGPAHEVVKEMLGAGGVAVASEHSVASPDGAACPMTGQVVSSPGGRVTRRLLAETEGIVERSITPEAPLDCFDQVMDDGRWLLLPNSQQHLGILAQALGAPIEQLPQWGAPS